MTHGTRARALFGLVDHHALTATPWGAAVPTDGTPPRDTLLGLRFDGETHWWRLAVEAPWAAMLVDALQAVANVLSEPEA